MTTERDQLETLKERLVQAQKWEAAAKVREAINALDPPEPKLPDVRLMRWSHDGHDWVLVGTFTDDSTLRAWRFGKDGQIFSLNGITLGEVNESDIRPLHELDELRSPPSWEMYRYAEYCRKEAVERYKEIRDELAALQDAYSALESQHNAAKRERDELRAERDELRQQLDASECAHADEKPPLPFYHRFLKRSGGLKSQ